MGGEGESEEEGRGGEGKLEGEAGTEVGVI